MSMNVGECYKQACFQKLTGDSSHTETEADALLFMTGCG